MRKNCHFVLYLVCFFLLIHPDGHAVEKEARLLRFPDIHENQLVFSYAGDLYIAASAGGIARRITSDEGYEMFARFSPDGSKIAFTARYDGNTEVYTMPAEGGKPRRLTYTANLKRDDIGDRMGPNNIVMDWHPDGQRIIFRSRKKSFNSFKGHLFLVSLDGEISRQIPLAEGGFCSYAQDGNIFYFNRVFREFRTWKNYRGGMADDIWMMEVGADQAHRLFQHPAQDIFPMWVKENLYFVSDRSGRMNLYQFDPEKNEAIQLTTYKDFDIKFPSAGKENIVYENGGYLYKYKVDEREAQKITVFISNDFTTSREDMLNVSSKVKTADLSPAGNRVVMSARGEVFSVPAKEGITWNLTQSVSAHDRDVAWSPDGKHLAYISDKSGEYEIYIQDQETRSKPVQITTGAETYKYTIKWSPDSKKILWGDQKLRLRYVDIKSREITEVGQGEYKEIRQYNWSPDSRWITYVKHASNEFGIIHVHEVGTGEKHALTGKWYHSTAPAFSDDGKYLYFASGRTFKPDYSWTEWNHVYQDMEKLYMILLQESTPSPFTPTNDELQLEKETGKEEEKKKENGEGEKPEVIIDFKNIQQRILELPVTAAAYTNIQGVQDKIYYNVREGKEQYAKVFDLKEKKESTLGANMQYTISANKKKMLVKQGSQFAVVNLPSGTVSMRDALDLSNMKVMVDYPVEWKQIYHEAWRQMRDFFYVENMHGVDWPAVRDKYAPLLQHVNHRDDLTYIMGEMIGELNVGHAYVNSPSKNLEQVKTGLLGAELKRTDRGPYKIEKILPGANWSAKLASPLNQPGIKVNEGDYIIEINEKPVKEVNNIYSLLLDEVGNTIQITWSGPKNGKKTEKSLIQPIRDESELYYHEWVQKNIEKVSQATGDKVGYLHIPDMISHGLNEFAEHFYPQLDKNALIIDARGNGGGNVSPMIIERLRREITRATMRRNTDHPGPVPSKMMLGPMVLLIDKYTASDGDLFAYSFKKHGLGPVIGERSWGGVVGISGSLPFVDGGELRKPEFASYSAEKSEWIIEGQGVEPDITVINDPVKEYQGEDAQLQKAIELIQQNLDKYHELPPIPPPPVKNMQE